MTLDAVETWAALTTGVVAFEAERELVSVVGTDARTFLQGQLTQDLSGLSPGDSIESLILSPQGKIDAYVVVSCRHEEHFVLECAQGNGAVTVERLRRFKLRVKVAIDSVTSRGLLVRGPRSRAIAALAGEDVDVFAHDWAQLAGFDAFGDYSGLLDGCSAGDLSSLELARIMTGEPVMGAELTEKTIPQETPLTDRCVSFTKGCFTGQELVARLDARGARVARHLRGLIVHPGTRHRVPYVGEPVFADDDEVGRVTSSAFDSRRNRSYALAYIHRRIEPPAIGYVLAAGGEDRLEAEVLALPMPFD